MLVTDQPVLDDDWRELDEDPTIEEEVQIDEYDLASTPNDFNTTTIFNFIDSGAVTIPGFQRNYVWDLGRASKLIESLILGLPVPQVFLYELGRNDFIVIDGQQRLLTIYFFVKQRFPRKAKRGELRRLLHGKGSVPDEVLYDDEYFENFNLRLPDIADGKRNRFSRRNYSTLEEYRAQFDLRTIRNVIVKQIKPTDDDSSIYEMFHRLNTGGVNLTPQEIRLSLYYSPFYEMLSALNLDPSWRHLLGQPEPDINLRDIEVLVRALAMFKKSSSYGSSMKQFLNRFSKDAQSYGEADVERLRGLLEWFVEGYARQQTGSDRLFRSPTGKFAVTAFEAAFNAAAKAREAGRDFVFDGSRLAALQTDEEFLSFAQAQSNKKANVTGRLRRAEELLAP